ncbi:MAG: hypothetical protein COV47_04000 [Candidatus Diapherotrites archaeon CG11_big_fil_rev_8_21_14_0_20_37_9]|nr:MAG: hypothetical protein COV47_04000 [Candidatus Diapherotrites archaeon CG11_big_fil_rev_8_21_14_0_20_37_9]
MNKSFLLAIALIVLVSGCVGQGNDTNSIDGNIMIGGNNGDADNGNNGTTDNSGGSGGNSGGSDDDSGNTGGSGNDNNNNDSSNGELVYNCDVPIILEGNIREAARAYVAAQNCGVGAGVEISGLTTTLVIEYNKRCNQQVQNTFAQEVAANTEGGSSELCEVPGIKEDISQNVQAVAENLKEYIANLTAEQIDRYVQ